MTEDHKSRSIHRSLVAAAAPDETPERYRAPALDKGLDIIELLSASDEGLTQSSISKALGRSPNEIYRMLDTLVRRNYVARDGDSYRLTLKVFALAHQHPPMRRLVAEATPGMRALSHWAGQSCLLAVYDRGNVLVIAQYDSPNYYGFSIRVGSRIGLLDTGSGRVLLAFAPTHERALMLAEQPRSPRATRPARLSDELDRIRARGYERMKSRQIEGVVNLSVPIVMSNGAALAALSVPFLHRIDLRNAPALEAVLARMREIAGRLTDSIGGILPDTARRRRTPPQRASRLAH
ncbi:MAG: IclR family transcriptional regulator [Alphaproteobacteria bacterium]|nr:IclR family transcriptional regulator [Alphaproteobacteria bacterium]